jgi:hypothetical protein
VDFLLEDMENDEEPIVHVAEESGTLFEMALELEELKRELDELEARRKPAQARYDELRKKKIPDLMRAAGMINEKGKGSFTTATGATIFIKNDVYAYVNKANEDQFFEHLEKTGNASLVKRTVHPGTLKAYARELLEEGAEIPPVLSVTTEQSVSLRKGRGN